MMDNWENKRDLFPVIDVRYLTNNFLPMILQKAQQVNIDDGLCIIQSFEPKPLYSAMKDLGFEQLTEKVSEHEYRAYFYRVEKKPITYETGADMPFKPTAILNYKFIDDFLASNIVNFWEQIWEKKDAAIDLKTKLLLSMSNAIGSSRFRQATRELIKAYSMGVTVEELDELFSLFAWNQGIGHFSSEIGPSTVFGVYRHIKSRENKGIDRKTIVDELLEIFGDQNPEVNTFFKKRSKPCKKRNL
jgi:alkylhydroperoxidase/carboxymuconolactone decarboxylase family protein YurZ